MSNTVLVPELDLDGLKALRAPMLVCISREAPRATRFRANCPPQ